MNQNFESLAGTLTVIGKQITHLEVTTSTMDVAWQQANEGALDGAIVIADSQSAGRGRHDRSWISRGGQDILCSVILRPRVALAGELLMLAALAVTDVTEALGVDAGIKWPNDVQVKGKKLAGVIAESKTGPDPDVEFDVDDPARLGANVDRITVVIGIGINVNFDPKTELDAAPESTSLVKEFGGDVNRQDVFEKLMQALDVRYSSITAGGTVMPVWRNRLTTLGREVTIASGKPGDSIELRGLAHEVDSIGRLIVRDENGRDWPVAAGEVTVRSIQ
jgi:BirA family biotin operon repressor/biotin-[acetyl-CoA-carboxylase] ligase